MAGMAGLGRVFNVVPSAHGLFIAMTDCSAISFVCTSGNSDVFNFQEAKTSGGGSAQDIGAVIDHYWEATDNDGSVHWAKTTQTAADETQTVTTGHCVVVSIYASMLDDGFDWVSCTASASGAVQGAVIAITHDLTVQRTPPNLSLIGE